MGGSNIPSASAHEFSGLGSDIAMNQVLRKELHGVINRDGVLFMNMRDARKYQQQVSLNNILCLLPQPQLSAGRLRKRLAHKIGPRPTVHGQMGMACEESRVLSLRGKN
ncbi:hypothetical protein, variant 2 [Blastomyces gilchristii SLH14081]|uniref:Uncharacterized protein n=3 Tax=Blastomyces TaxID=229219 RepID=A0A179UNB5_BLAGS|nr:uncharacterized protein BDBG_03927 [Blastomyces gilchristii SLH14081]XP_031578023.1 hypothetical protein, variant 1 [Blastomyces gilchristii SLH14081]XP_031578024.1 hypothetical protein, variant 2 [Blastomyces gilchristii SLH14081]EQL34209.1 hypothetical protein BDFG_03877 [Blastomyces dermatitidis ATCC 26199]OAT07912.1 hypothetical protein BDBG_03927 [Blastomyces gilchristii SLH14081]OAT07913.1 hypothetical protein, variant 1 [Blastomyces gilchristii SLH14081]OAT07914.1 hypothetical prote